MKERGTSARAGVARLVLLAAGLLAASAAAQDWGDTPYVQTPQNVVDRMLEIAQIKRDDYVIDLGSGDGRMVITAATRYGARGFGVDLDRRLVALSNRNAKTAGVADRAEFFQRDLHQTDFSRASVLSIYLLPEVNLMIRGRILATLRPGSRVVSHDYNMGSWPPDYQTEMAAPGKTVGIGERSKVFFWVVPGRAAGRWRWQLAPDGKPAPNSARPVTRTVTGAAAGANLHAFELVLQQNFQVLEGTLASGAQSTRIQNGKLTGEEIAFSAALDGSQYEFSGRIYNHALEGKARLIRDGNTRELQWSATRVEIWDPRHAALTREDAIKEIH